MAELSTVNRVVVGSSPTLPVDRNPCALWGFLRFRRSASRYVPVSRCWLVAGLPGRRARCASLRPPGWCSCGTAAGVPNGLRACLAVKIRLVKPEVRVDAMVAEYVSARDEMIAAISNQHLALTFGTASIVAAFAAGFLTWDDPAAPGLFFAIAPLTTWVFIMWLGEVVRMLRAVEFCTAQADIVNALATPDEPVLRWESWRAEKGQPQRTIQFTYLATAITLSGAYVGALACGAITGASGWGWWWVGPIIAVAAAIEGIFLAWVNQIFRIWKSTDVGMQPLWQSLWPRVRDRE